MNDIASILTVIGALTVLTNLITEVIKPITQIKMPTELTATIVAEVLTLIAFFGWADYTHLEMHWYYIAADAVMGLLVGYAAQFGFDKLKSALQSINGGGNGTSV